jgi:SPP1 family predicted phage head-tail adaptor
MQAGKLNRRITIQRQSIEQDEVGQPEPVWIDVAADIWAGIAHKTGLQTLSGSAEVSVVQASIRVRYRVDLAAGMRVLHGETVYKVAAVLPDEEAREHVDLVCEVTT